MQWRWQAEEGVRSVSDVRAFGLECLARAIEGAGPLVAYDVRIGAASHAVACVDVIACPWIADADSPMLVLRDGPRWHTWLLTRAPEVRCSYRVVPTGPSLERFLIEEATRRAELRG